MTYMQTLYFDILIKDNQLTISLEDDLKSPTELEVLFMKETKELADKILGQNISPANLHIFLNELKLLANQFQWQHKANAIYYINSSVRIKV